jgi:hypothetical protein
MWALWWTHWPCGKFLCECLSLPVTVFSPVLHRVHINLSLVLYNVEPGYNDIGLYDISPIESHILWYQLILYASVITIVVDNDTIYSPFHYVITEFDCNFNT